MISDELRELFGETAEAIPEDAIRIPGSSHAPSREGASRPVDSVLLALDGTVLPGVTDTLVVAEHFRACVMGASRRIAGGDPGKVSTLLSGKSASGIPLEDHQHAYYLPSDLDGDGRIDHIAVRCSGGLCREDQLAIGGVPSLWQSKGRPDIRLVSVASGASNEILQTCRAWQSSTPFVTPRHYKSTRGEFGTWLEGELHRALRQHGLPDPMRIEPVSALALTRTSGQFRWAQFTRARKNDTPRTGFGFRITFAEDVVGPFAVGYGAHFGLGQFLPASHFV